MIDFVVGGFNISRTLFRNNRPEVFLGKGVLKIYSKFIEITLRYGCSPVNLLHIFRTPFPKNTFGWVFLFDDVKVLIFFSCISKFRLFFVVDICCSWIIFRQCFVDWFIDVILLTFPRRAVISFGYFHFSVSVSSLLFHLIN